VLWGLQIGLALILALALAGHRASFFGEILASILPQIAAACALASAVAVISGQPGAALASLITAGVALWGAREQFERSNISIATPDARVVWANLWSRKTALRRVVAIATRENADAIALAEFPPNLSPAQRAELLGPFTHAVSEALACQTIVRIFSRHPIVEEGISGGGERRALFAKIVVRGCALTIAAVHPRVPYLPFLFRRREATIRTAIAEAARREPGVLVGDFNTVPWSGIFREVRAEGVARRAQIAGCSWVTPWPIIGLPIDHAFVVGEMEIAARSGGFIWSDHYPLIVDIRLPRAASVGTGTI
jgi:endonuclease/exonuclease/phosphatase (EEP) superfamily protein YafD